MSSVGRITIDSFYWQYQRPNRKVVALRESFMQSLTTDLVISSQKEMVCVIKMINVLNCNIKTSEMISLIDEVSSKLLFPTHVTRAIKRAAHQEHHCVDLDIAFTGVVSSKNANQALEYAVEVGDVEIGEKALALGADPNGLWKGSIPFLLLAAKNGFATIVSLLLSKGANARVIRGSHYHQTPLSEALLHGSLMDSCLEALRLADGGFTDWVMLIKFTAHAFSIEKTIAVGQEKFLTTGFRPRYVLPQLLSCLEDFYAHLRKKNPEGELTIGEGETVPLSVIESVFPLLKSCQDFIHLTVEEMVDKIDSGSPFLLYGLILCSISIDKIESVLRLSFDEPGLHAWALLIQRDMEEGNYVAFRCNRGFGCRKSPGILFGIIREKKDLIDLLQQFKRWNNWHDKSSFSGGPYEGCEKKFLKDRMLVYKQKRQKVGNCTLKSLTSLHAATLFIQTRHIENIDSLDITRAVQRKLSRFLQKTQLKKLLEFPNDEFRIETLQFISDILKKVNGRPEYEAIYNEIQSWSIETGFPLRSLSDHCDFNSIIDSILKVDFSASLSCYIKGHVEIEIENQSLLMIAIKHKAKNCAEYLINHGASPNIGLDDQGYTLPLEKITASWFFQEDVPEKGAMIKSKSRFYINRRYFIYFNRVIKQVIMTDCPEVLNSMIKGRLDVTVDGIPLIELPLLQESPKCRAFVNSLTCS